MTPPLDRVSTKKFNMGTESESGTSRNPRTNRAELQCMKCGTETAGDTATARRCAGCSSFFHLTCLSHSSAALAAEYTALYKCRLCRISDPLGKGALMRIHAILESCDDPLADVMAFTLQRSRLLEREVTELRARVALIESVPPPHQQPMEFIAATESSQQHAVVSQQHAVVTQQQTAIDQQKKRALLFGDGSVKKL